MKQHATAWLLVAALLAVCGRVAPAHAAASAALPRCPDLLRGQPDSQARAIERSCGGGSTCESCQCEMAALLRVSLTGTGEIVASELYTPAAALVLANSMAACYTTFVGQLANHTLMTAPRVAALARCAPASIEAVARCTAGARAAAAAAARTADAQATAAAIRRRSDAMLDGLFRRANLTAGNGTGAVAALSVEDEAGAGAGAAEPQRTTTPASPLAMTPSNTRGTIRWRARCYCDERYAPVCDPATRKMYPSACSAKCQMVAQPVACAALRPLASQVLTRDNVAFTLLDESLMPANRRRALDGAAPLVVASDGPMPAELPAGDAQTWYYYYTDDDDDTQEATDAANTVVHALLSAKFGAKAATAGAQGVAKADSPHPAAAPAASSADAPPASSGLRGMMSGLRNITLTRQRRRAPGSRAPQQPAAAAAAAERSTVTVPAARAANSSQPAEEADWMSTRATDQAAGVYTRDPQRTSRILAALMATAQDGRDNASASAAVGDASAAGLDGAVKAASGVAERQRPAGGRLGAPLRASAAQLLPNVFATSDARRAARNNATAATTTRATPAANATAASTEAAAPTTITAAAPAAANVTLTADQLVTALQGLADTASAAAGAQPVGLAQQAQRLTAATNRGAESIQQVANSLATLGTAAKLAAPFIPSVEGRSVAQEVAAMGNAAQFVKPFLGAQPAGAGRGQGRIQSMQGNRGAAGAAQLLARLTAADRSRTGAALNATGNATSSANGTAAAAPGVRRLLL